MPDIDLKDEKALESGDPVDTNFDVIQKPRFFSRSWIVGPVDKDHGDLALLACCLATGLTDSASFANWGVFVGMQTGNTVILGLSTAGLPNNPHGWMTTLVAISSFLVGCFCTFHIAAWVTPKGVSSNRLFASSLLFVQGLFIVVAAALATPKGLIPQNPGDSTRNTPSDPRVLHNVHIVALIPLLAIQSGIQISTSRLLGFNEIPVNVLTSTYCDIMGDFKLLALNNVKRNRRVAAVVLLLTGSISSGWLMRTPGRLECVLWFSAGIKLLTGIAMFCFMAPAKGTK